MTPPTKTPIDAVQVRRASLDDVAAGVDLMRRLAVFEGHAAAFTATPERLAEGLFGPVPGLLCWVAESDGRILGIALCATTWVGITCRPSLRLLNLVVDDAIRGHGVGSRLMAAVAAKCVELECSLDWMIRTNNVPAQRFYLKFGATPREEWQPWQMSREALRSLAGTDASGEVTNVRT